MKNLHLDIIWKPHIANSFTFGELGRTSLQNQVDILKVKATQS